MQQRDCKPIPIFLVVTTESNVFSQITDIDAFLDADLEAYFSIVVRS